jgi:hypothetical protein
MIRYIPWLERVFRFDFPVGEFATIVERVRGTPARLEDRLARLPRATLVARPDGKWSVQEHAGHLADLIAIDSARLDDFAANRPILTAADMANRRTADALHNDRTIEDVLAGFRLERTAFVRRLDALDDAFVARAAIHPRLGVSMRVVDWVHFVAEHDDHHMAAIAAALRPAR